MPVVVLFDLLSALAPNLQNQSEESENGFGGRDIWRLLIQLSTPGQAHGFVLGVWSISKDHRITEWVGLGGTFEGHLVQSPCHEQGHLHPDQVAQSPVQTGLECFQGWDINHLSGQPLPPPSLQKMIQIPTSLWHHGSRLHQPLPKIVFLTSDLNFLCCNFSPQLLVL